jgi:hypothetical protein
MRPERIVTMSENGPDVAGCDAVLGAGAVDGTVVGAVIGGGSAGRAEEDGTADPGVSRPSVWCRLLLVADAAATSAAAPTTATTTTLRVVTTAS